MDHNDIIFTAFAIMMFVMIMAIPVIATIFVLTIVKRSSQILFTRKTLKK